MSVTVVLPGTLRELNHGRPTLVLDGAPRTVAEAFEGLREAYPAVHRRVITETGDVRPHINVFVGDTEIRRASGLQTALDDGVEIVILPAVSGG